MKRAIAIAAGVIAFVACTSAQSGGLSVDPAFAETRVIVLRCGGLYGQYEAKFNPASYGTGFGECAFGRCVPKHGSRAVGDLDHGIEFRIDKDPSWKMRIDWREQAYSVYFITQERDGKAEIVDAGFCRESRELPQLPAPVSVRQSADTTNAPRAEIKVVAPETREKAAVITVSGHFNKGDSIRFFDAVEKIQNATVYLESRGGNAYAGVGIGEIIRERGFRTAVINSGKCFSACALAWLAGTKRYLGALADVGFHTPYHKKTLTVQDAAARGLAYAYERASARVMGIVNSYLVSTLGLKKEAADYATAAPPETFLHLTQKDGQRVGIEFTTLNLPDYKPLP